VTVHLIGWMPKPKAENLLAGRYLKKWAGLVHH
jgi:hypothetical protein